MIETIVSLETARLLKEKGFNEPCLYYFGCDDKGNLIPKCVAGIQDCECRTVEDLYIQNNLSKCGGNGSCIKEIEDDTFFNTYEDALEEGLKQALKLI